MGFIILKSGYPPYMLLVVFIIADVIWRMAELYMMHVILNFPLRKYCLRVYLPVGMACLPVAFCLFFTSRIQIDSALWHISHVILIFLLTAVSASFLGLRKHEREKILTQIVRHIHG